MAGDFTFLHTVAVDSKGNLYTGETVGGRRVQRFVKNRGEGDND
jgi:sugar lactone lactonase YvrE